MCVCMWVFKSKHGYYPRAKAFLQMLQLGEALVDRFMDHLSCLADTISMVILQGHAIAGPEGKSKGKNPMSQHVCFCP